MVEGGGGGAKARSYRAYGLGGGTGGGWGGGWDGIAGGGGRSREVTAFGSAEVGPGTGHSPDLVLTTVLGDGCLCPLRTETASVLAQRGEGTSPR